MTKKWRWDMYYYYYYGRETGQESKKKSGGEGTLRVEQANTIL